MAKLEIWATYEEVVEWVEKTGGGSINETLRLLIQRAVDEPQLPPAPRGQRASNSVRLSDELAAEFRAKCAAARMTVSDYLRATANRLDGPSAGG